MTTRNGRTSQRDVVLGIDPSTRVWDGRGFRGERCPKKESCSRVGDVPDFVNDFIYLVAYGPGVVGMVREYTVTQRYRDPLQEVLTN